MAIEIIVNGNQQLDLYDSEEMKYTIQIGDIFELSSIKASYTTSFRIPKTEKNSTILNGLGLVSDTSIAPYQRIPAVICDAGLPISKKGWLQVINTTDYTYNVTFIDGYIDFDRAIDNLTVGADLNLSELNHIKNPETVAESWDNETYRYILASYAGNTIFLDKINTDALTPSARLKYIWDKMFERVGWTYSGALLNNQDFLTDWVTYPVSEANLVYNDVMTAYKGYFEESARNYYLTGKLIDGQWVYGYDFWDAPKVFNPINIIDPTAISTTNNWAFYIQEQGQYQINIELYAFNYFYAYVVQKVYRDLYIGIRYKDVMRIVNAGNMYETGEAFTYQIQENFNVGDKIELFYLAPTEAFTQYLTHNYTNLNVKKIDGDYIVFGNKVLDWPLKDFFKEQVLRFGLTPVVDVENKNIDFISSEQRLNLDTKYVIDWSDKYIKRTNESYIYGSYAQRNFFRHKYNEDQSNYNDGSINVANLNLEDEKTLYTSRTYAYRDEFFQFSPMQLPLTYVYPMFEAETYDDNGFPMVRYKPLTNRMYYIKAEVLDDTVPLISQSTLEEENYVNPSIAVSKDTQFIDLIPKYYRDYIEVLNNARVHEIELALTTIDIHNLDMTRVYFFRQENAYYLLNRIIYENNKPAKGEFIKIKK